MRAACDQGARLPLGPELINVRLEAIAFDNRMSATCHFGRQQDYRHVRSAAQGGAIATSRHVSYAPTTDVIPRSSLVKR